MALNQLRLPVALFVNIGEMTLTEIAYVVANTLLGHTLGSAQIKEVVERELDVRSYEEPICQWSLTPQGLVHSVLAGAVSGLTETLCQALPQKPVAPRFRGAAPIGVAAATAEDVAVAVCCIFIFATYAAARAATPGNLNPEVKIGVRRDVSQVPRAVAVAQALGLPVSLGVIANNIPSGGVEDIEAVSLAQGNVASSKPLPVIELCMKG